MSYDSTVLATTGLLAYYQTDQATAGGAGAMTDSKGGYNGTYNNIVAFQQAGPPGIGNCAIQLNGTTSWCSIPYNVAFLNSAATNPATLEVWFKFSSAPAGEVFLMQNGATMMNIALEPTGAAYDFKISIYNVGDPIHSTVTSDALADGNWHHIVAVYAGATTNGKMYLDGVDTSGPADGTIVATAQTNTTAVGAYDGTHRLFTGYLAKPAFYTTALSLATAQAHYTAGITAPAVTLAAAAASASATGSDAAVITAAPLSAAASAAVATGRSMLLGMTLGACSAAATGANATVLTAAPLSASTVSAAVTATGALSLIQQIRPTSDIVTTGWSAAPLWSKISDQSDATYITATLG